jgi:hypothetical protein
MRFARLLYTETYLKGVPGREDQGTLCDGYTTKENEVRIFL